MPNCVSYILDIIEKEKPTLIKVEHKRVPDNFEIEKAEKKIEYEIEYGGYLSGYVWSNMIQSELIKNNNISFRTDMKYGEDALFQYYVYLALEQCDKVVSIRDIMYFYRMRSQSAMHSADEKAVSCQVECFINSARTYQVEYSSGKINDKNKLLATKRRMHMAIMNALTFMPGSDLDRKGTIKKLKKEKLYPFPMLWWHIRDARGIKGKLLELTRNLFKFSFVYFIYYKLAKRSKIVKKHKKK